MKFHFRVRQLHSRIRLSDIPSKGGQPPPLAAMRPPWLPVYWPPLGALPLPLVWGRSRCRTCGHSTYCAMNLKKKKYPRTRNYYETNSLRVILLNI